MRRGHRASAAERRAISRLTVLCGIAGVLAVALLGARLYSSIEEQYQALQEAQEREAKAKATAAKRSKIKEQTVKMPQADRVVVSLLDLDGTETEKFPIRPYDMNAAVIKSIQLDGQAAEDLARLWRTRGFGGGYMFCHFPAYGLRFFAGDKLLVETSLCWMCQNCYVQEIDGGYDWLGFHDRGGELYKELSRLLPPPPEPKARPKP